MNEQPPRRGLLGKVRIPDQARIYSFADQGLQGASNVIVLMILARFMSVDQFASVGLSMGLYYFFVAFHRSSVILPFILACGRNGNDLRTHSDWWSINVYFGLGATALVGSFLAVAAVFSSYGLVPTWIIGAVIYLLAMMLPLSAAEFGRRASYQGGKPQWAMATSLAYFVAGVATAIAAGWLHVPLLGGYSFAAAGLAGFIVYLLRRRPTMVALSAALLSWKPYAGFSVWQSLASFFSVLYTASAVVLVATFAGAAGAALYTVARTLVNPALSIVSAVDSLDKPRAARALAESGVAGLRASIRQTRRLLIVLTGTYLALVMLLAPWALAVLFRETYSTNVLEVRILAAAFFFMCLNQPSETMLVVLQSPRHLFAIRCGAAFVAVLAVWLASQAYGVAGAALALAGVQVLVLVALYVAERSAVRIWQNTEAAQKP